MNYNFIEKFKNDREKSQLNFESILKIIINYYYKLYEVKCHRYNMIEAF